MNVTRAARFLKVKHRNLFPVPSVNSIIRVGKIPRTEKKGEFWTPAWKISRRYNENQVLTILTMLRKGLGNFAIAFENEDNYLILSDGALDESYAGKIVSEISLEKSKGQFKSRQIRRLNEPPHVDEDSKSSLCS
jgi:hypothetical protein